MSDGLRHGLDQMSDAPAPQRQDQKQNLFPPLHSPAAGPAVNGVHRTQPVGSSEEPQ